MAQRKRQAIKGYDRSATEGLQRVQLIERLKRERPEAHKLFVEKGLHVKGGATSGQILDLIHGYDLGSTDVSRIQNRIKGKSVNTGEKKVPMRKGTVNPKTATSAVSKNKAKVIVRKKKKTPQAEDTLGMRDPDAVFGKKGGGVLQPTAAGFEPYDAEKAAQQTAAAQTNATAPETKVNQIQLLKERQKELLESLNPEDRSKILDLAKRDITSAESRIEAIRKARSHWRNREPNMTKFLSQEDMKNLLILKEYDKGFYGSTRYQTNPAYDKFDSLVKRYKNEIERVGEFYYPEWSKDRVNFNELHSWERGHLIPKAAQPHVRDVNAAISGQSAKSNQDSWAEYKFGEMVDNMDRGKSADVPHVRQEEMQRLRSLIKDLSSKGYDTRELSSIYSQFQDYPTFTPVIPKDSEIGRLKIINDKGNPRSFNDMFRNGELSSNLGEARNQYERIRRLAVTMMSENPEFDLEGFLSTRKVPDEFLNGFEIDPKLERRVSVYDIMDRNSGVGDGMFLTRAGAAEALKRGGGKLGAALTLLAASGAVFASDEDPMDASTWSEATMNKVLSVMEQLGQYEQAGMGAIQQAIPGAAQVGQAYNQGIGFLNWGKGQQTSAPVVYDESGQPTGGGTWNAQKGFGDYVDFARQLFLPVEDAALVVGAAAPRKGIVQSWFSPTFDEDTVSP